MKKYNLSWQILNVAFSLLVCIFTTFILSSFGFILHIGINIFYSIVALIISVGVLFYTLKKNNGTKKDFIYSFLIFLFVILSAYVLAISKYDSYMLDNSAIQRAGTNYLYITTIPFALIIFRLLLKIYTCTNNDDPSEIICKDRGVLMLSVLYIVTFGIVLNLK